MAAIEDPSVPLRFYWIDSTGFRCWGFYFPRSGVAYYPYGSLGDRPRHRNLVWIDEPPAWARKESSGA